MRGNVVKMVMKLQDKVKLLIHLLKQKFHNEPQRMAAHSGAEGKGDLSNIEL